MHKLGQFAGTQFFIQQIEFACLFCSKTQRLDLTFDFGFDVVDAGQVGSGIVQTPHSFFFTHPELGNTSGFFKQSTAFFRTAVQYFIDLILTDNGHRTTSQTSICQKVKNVF